MSYKLKHYQKDAVDKLISRTEIVLKENSYKTIQLISITGSGKTYIIGEFISELVQKEQEDLCFLFLTPGKGELEIQSYKSINNFNKNLNCIFIFDAVRNGIIKQNEIVFANYEKIWSMKNGKYKNTIMRDSEQDNFFDMIKNIKDEGRKIILLIDESHYAVDSNRVSEIKKEINPCLTIEMTATPKKYVDNNFDVFVDPNEVIKEEMIKKEVEVNHNIKNITSKKQLIITSIDLRDRLEHYYKEEHSNVSPLVFIQIENSEKGETQLHEILEILKEYNFTTENKSIAIALDKNKINYEPESLKSFNSTVKFLIFKESIALGFDCPRGQILLTLREVKSETFRIQTVGRILRMPEHKHYLNPVLNKAYVITNVAEINVDQEYEKFNFIKTIFSKKKKNIKNITINSYYNNYDDSDLEHIDLYEFFKDTFEENKDKINYDIKPVSYNTIQHTSMSSPNFFNNDYSYGKCSYYLDADEINKEFNKLLKKEKCYNIIGFKDIVYSIFKKTIKLCNDECGIINIQKICLNNICVISKILNQCYLEYNKIIRNRRIEKVSQCEYHYEWNIPNEISHNIKITKEINIRKYSHEPNYIRLDGGPTEENFILMIERMNCVDFFYKNGSTKSLDNFGIKYENHSIFYPDWIVVFLNGKIGIFDTKNNKKLFEKDNKIKAEALQMYVEEQNSKGFNLIGGIVIENNNHFLLNNKLDYIPFNSKPEDWLYFEEFFEEQK